MLLQVFAVRIFDRELTYTVNGSLLPMVWKSKNLLLLRSLILTPAIAISLWLLTSYPKKEEQLVLAKPMTVLSQQLPVTIPPPSATRPKLIVKGDRISLNGRVLPVAWSQWQIGANAAALRTAISDAGLIQAFGVELLSSWDLTKQPVQWFSDPVAEREMLLSWLTNQYRYLDITDFAREKGWRVQAEGNTLQIQTPPAIITNLRQGRQAEGHRIVLDLDRPTPWQVIQEGAKLTLQVDSATNPTLIETFNPQPAPTNGANQNKPDEENDNFPVSPDIRPPISTDIPLAIQSTQNQTTIRLEIPSGLRSRVWSIPNPDRLVIDLMPEVMVERDIIWASGIRYREKIIELGKSRFPVVWLEINPQQSVRIRPIWSNSNSLVGTAPLIEQSRQWQAIAAINAGFFNRNTQLPLGAIRQDGNWISSPILNRGAIGWNDEGEFKIGRLSLQETLITSNGDRLPIVSVNSGYLQPGIALHTPKWGTNYTPITDREIIYTVQNDRVINAEVYNRNNVANNVINKTSYPIPANGYLLILRDYPNPNLLAVGSKIGLESRAVPSEFDRYPYIIGAGPVLLANRQIVLDAKAEQFRDSFIQQSAHRACIGTTAAGTILIVSVGNRTGGLGPTLTEIARIIQQMGAVDALNLDGGSSTSLYLGGQLLNRSPRNAARVHNGLGIFLTPNP